MASPPTTAHAQKLKNATTAFLSIAGWQSPVAVTLTLKQGQVWDGRFVSLTSDICRQNFRHFMNLLNKRIHRNGFARFGKRIKASVVVERDASGRLHQHAALERPEQIDTSTFEQMIRDAWVATRWGHREIDIQHDADDGWINYMTKSRSKDDFDLSIDWANCSLH